MLEAAPLSRECSRSRKQGEEQSHLDRGEDDERRARPQRLELLGGAISLLREQGRKQTLDDSSSQEGEENTRHN